MSDWKQYTLTTSMEAPRQGWVGVWDALVSAVTRKPRYTFTQPVTISFWAKHNSDVSFSNVQAETKGQQ